MRHPIFLKYIELISNHEEMQTESRELEYIVAALEDHKNLSCVYWSDMSRAIGDPNIDEQVFAEVTDDGWNSSPELYSLLTEIVNGTVSFEGKELEDYL